MSKALKCDRCGTFYEPYKHHYLILSGNMKSLDLCPGCMGSFIKWIDECKGKWIKSAEDEYDCSECGETVMKPSEKCPFCGTKMIIKEAADDVKRFD